MDGRAEVGGRDRTGVVAIASLVASLALAALSLRLALVFDDAYISFRYSRHLADGLGLRFNAGVEPPVEGYSNLLWVLWCALPEALGFAAPGFALASTLASGVALVFLVTRFAARRLQLDVPAIVLVALFLGLWPPVAVYATGGLESLPFTLAIFALFAALLEHPGRPRVAFAGAAAVATVLLRPDGVLWVALVALIAAHEGHGRKERRLVRGALVAGGAGGLALVAQTALRLAYHGDWVPNTVRAKASMSAFTLERGATYLAAQFAHSPALVLLLVAGIVALIASRRRLLVQGLAMFAATAAYSVLVGGDFLPMGRFLLPAAPFLALVLACLLADGSGFARGGAAVLLGLALLAHFDVQLVPESVRARTHYNWNLPEYRTELELLDGERERARDWAELGRALADYAEPGDSLVIGTVGAVGYYSDLVLFDQFGLVDREVAALPWHGRRLAAGHDRYAPPRFFEDRDPTFLTASLIDVDEEGRPLGPPLPERVGRELVPLDPARGLPRGKALMVVRAR